MNPVYFSKVEFRTYMGRGPVYSRLLVNVEEGEVSYQAYKWKKNMPAITGRKTEDTQGVKIQYDFNLPGRVIRNGSTQFQPMFLLDNDQECEIKDSFGYRLSDAERKELLLYCNALEFEPYRNREMSMDDEGYEAYRDEDKLEFIGITNSYLPKLELPMNYLYDEAHMWPSERLY